MSITSEIRQAFNMFAATHTYTRSNMVTPDRDATRGFILAQPEFLPDGFNAIAGGSIDAGLNLYCYGKNSYECDVTTTNMWVG